MSLKPIIFFLLTGHLLLGIGYIALLPPWEGFDETAHYSTIQQIADTKTLPKYGSARISRDVDKYSDVAPIPYRSSPPVEENGGYTYKSFFGQPPDVILRGSDFIHSMPQRPREFVEGKKFNWQAQHPPLYYLIIAPFYLATKNHSWRVQIFVIRLISYLFAWIALLIVALICLKKPALNSLSEDSRNNLWVLSGLGIWPLIFHSWFTDMARMGNDSLCALFIALVWFVLLKYSCKSSPGLYITLGILLGFGCLIKAFFVPVCAGLSVYLFLRRWKIDGKSGLKYNLFHLLLMLSIVIIISGWWFLLNWYNYGVILGSDEMIRLKNMGGLLLNLFNKFSLTAWVRGHAAAVTTFAWSGTWSFARPPYIYLVPLTLMVLFFVFIYLYSIRRYKITRFEWLPFWFTIPVIAGFGYHVLIRIALSGEGRGTGGYYLHFLIVPLVFALGLGLKNIWKFKMIRTTGIVLFMYAIILSTILYFCQLFLFSGVMQISGDNKFYQLSNGYNSMLDWSIILSRLDVLAFPYVGFPILIVGLTSVIISLWWLWSRINRKFN